MPELRTSLLLSASIPPEHLAVGLHHPAEKLTYYFDRFETPSILIGRSSAKCDIQIKARKVSKLHASLERLEGGATIIRDIGSTNGTYVNERPIREPTVLLVGMVVRIGRTELVAVNAEGGFPLCVYCVGQLCHRALELYGDGRLAAKHLGVGRKFIRVHAKTWKHTEVYGT